MASGIKQPLVLYSAIGWLAYKISEVYYGEGKQSLTRAAPTPKTSAEPSVSASYNPIHAPLPMCWQTPRRPAFRFRLAPLASLFSTPEP